MQGQSGAGTVRSKMVTDRGRRRTLEDEAQEEKVESAAAIEDMVKRRGVK